MKMGGSGLDTVQADQTEVHGSREGVDKSADGFRLIVLHKKLTRVGVMHDELHASNRDSSQTSAPQHKRSDAYQLTATPRNAHQGLVFRVVTVTGQEKIKR
jgi:hypothetical protein